MEWVAKGLLLRGMFAAAAWYRINCPTNTCHINRNVAQVLQEEAEGEEAAIEENQNRKREK